MGTSRTVSPRNWSNTFCTSTDKKLNHKPETMTPSSQKIILALDVDTLKEAEHFVKKLSGSIGIFKVGKQLFTHCGPTIVEMIHRHGGKVFLDLKFHDIPNTVARAVEEACKLNVFMVTIHALGGKKMMQEAVAASSTFARNSSLETGRLERHWD
jgi:orotidine-5'-phosphate decarboxylase